MTNTSTPSSVFAKEVIEGLCKQPKRLSSKYFYDEKGDKLFQEIMKMEEYYLTKSEYEILSLQKQNILSRLMNEDTSFQLVEFGAGDGLKTKLLLDFLLKKEIDFEYYPIDISEHVLKELEDSLNEQWPKLKCIPIVDTYFNALQKLPSNKKKMVLFLGSNIGNFNLKEARNFLLNLNNNLNQGDYFLLGVDLKKDPELVLSAYNDKQGITKAFNLNLLERMNRELGANFSLEDFSHFPTYDPVSGETKSYLISKKDQTIHFSKLNEEIEFSYSEPIFMEISKKYDLKELKQIAEETNFEIVEHFYDCKHYFLNTLWKKR